MPSYVIRQRRHSQAKWRYEKVYTLSMDDSLSWVRWIERFVIGSTDPFVAADEEQQAIELYQIKESIEELGAQIIGIERGWRTHITSDNIEQVAQYTAYHLGFSVRPDHRNCIKAQFKGEHNKSEKFVVGSTNFVKPRKEYEIENQINQINRTLTHARIVGHELNFTFGKCQGKERVLSYLVYHLGFKHTTS